MAIQRLSEAGCTTYYSSPTLTNAILWGNTPDQIAGDPATVTYSDIQGGYAGTGNINADPKFVDAASGNLRLQPGSPAIDAGNNAAVPTGVTTDLDGSPRLVDIPGVPNSVAGYVDMGAYEAQPSAPILYVDREAPGPVHDGKTWAQAFTGLQTALATAGVGTEIWVAQGVYYPGSPINRTATFQLVKGVALYGGFAGAETTREQRDWSAHQTMLSGDIDHNDVTAGGVVTDTARISGSNAYHVVSSAGVTTTAVLDGFTITGGNANGSDLEHRWGGGMYNDGSSPTLSNVTFSGNSASYNGGGMSTTITATHAEQRDLLRQQRKLQAAGCKVSSCFFFFFFFYNYNSNPTLSNVTFSGNSASYYGGGMYNYSAAPR